MSSVNSELFTTRVRKETRKIHSVSDALVNAKFAISSTDETVWGGALFAFYHIFAYVEDANQRLNMRDFKKLFVNKVLYRKRAFEEDLRHYFGEEWRKLPKSSALENYLQHLQDLERENPQLLMAYMYHLYLGLLSGGQILANKKSMFGNKDVQEGIYMDKATEFRDVDIGQLKKNIKAAMNSIAEQMTEEEKKSFIEESNHVFLMNNLIVNSIGGQNRALYNLFYKASAIVLLVIGVVLAVRMNK